MKRASPEQQLQQAVVRWLDLVGVTRKAIVFHVPNGGKRTRTEAKIFKGMGVRAGVADLVFVWRVWIQGTPVPHVGFIEPVPRVGFIELKAPGSKAGPSDNQKLFRADCEALGAPYVVARSIDDVDAALRAWGVPRKINLGQASGGSDVG